MMAREDGVWQPGIGDPSVVGWVTVVAYVVVAAACARLWARDRSAPFPRSRSRVLWAFLSVLFVALGINKQLDLQSLLTLVGKAWAKEHGWYAQRRTFQAAFIGAVALGVGAMGLVALAWARHDLRRTGLPLLGAGMVLAYVVVRAASFHKVDVWIGREILGLRVNAWCELGGLALVGFGAWFAGRRPRL